MTMLLSFLVFSVFLSYTFVSSKNTIKRPETSDLNELKREVRAHRETSAAVAFFAYRSGNLGISSRYGRTYRTIIYDRVDLNIGNAYNRHNGIVTAPYTGVYLFHVSTAVCFKSWAIIQLIQNGRIRDISMPDSSMNGGHFRNQATTSTPLYLVKGDSVYVRIGHAHAGQCIESNRDIRTSFSGVKIH